MTNESSQFRPQAPRSLGRRCVSTMMLLALYHVMDLAGAFKQHAH